MPSLALQIRMAVAAWLVCIVGPCGHAVAQSLEERLDEDAFLNEVVRLRLPEVLRAYVSAHPTKDPFQAARYAIAAERITLADPELSEKDRLACIERIREIRDGLLAGAAGDDPRAAVALADQASDILFELLPTDAIGLSAVFGVPSAEQLRIAKRSASDIHALASQARQRIDSAIRALESRPGFATNFQLQDQRRRLAEEQRDLRIPFLLGVGAVLQAELNTAHTSQMKDLYDAGAASLGSIMKQLPHAARPTAMLYLAVALAARGEFDAAMTQISQIESDENASSADLLAARLAAVRITNLKGGPAAGLEAIDAMENDLKPPPPLAFQKLLFADQRFKLRKAMAAAASPDQQAALRAEAFAAYTDLLNADLDAPPEAVQAAVFERLVLVSPAEKSAEELPLIVVIAQADRLAAQRPTEAAEILRAVVDHDSTSQPAELKPFEHALALFVLAKALYASNQPVEAANRFIELADRFPTDFQAARAIDLGVAIAAEAHRTDPDNEDAGESLESALKVALSSFTAAPSVNQWRLLAARLALERDRFDDADQVLRQIPADSDQGIDALYLQAVTAHRRANAAPDDATGRRRTLHEAALPVIDAAALASTHRAEGSMSAQLGRNLLMLHVMRAQSLLVLDRPAEALEVLSGFERASNSSPDIVAEAMRVRIECHQAMGHPEEAVDEVKEFLEAAPQRAVVSILPLLRSIQLQVTALQEELREDQAMSLARGTLLPIAQLLEASLLSGVLGPDAEAHAGQHIAEAYRLSGDCDKALTWYERLLAANPDSPPLLLGRAECLFRLGGNERLAQAMTIFKRIATSTSDSQSDYWLSQLRMLQILDATGRNTQQIVPRIDRLRQNDANLGGERYRSGFDALRSKYAK